MPGAAEFFAELAERLEAVTPQSPAMDALLALGDDEANVLQLVDPAAHGLPAAITERFTEAWPKDQALGSQEGIRLVKGARERDDRLKKLSDRLVPKKVSERDFWRNYFSHAAAILASHAPSQEETVRIHMESMPAARPAAERRFPVKEPLRTKGPLPRDEILGFIKACMAMVATSESIDLCARQAVDEGEDIGGLMLHHQLELMESLGIDRKLGMWEMSPPVVMKRFPQDRELQQALQAFRMRCQQAATLAVQCARQRAPPAASGKRLYEPAASLRKDGDVSLAELSGILDEIREEVTSDTAKERLAVGVKAGTPADALLGRWEREILESKGLEQDFAMEQLKGIPARVRASQGSDGAEEGAAIVEKLQRLNEDLEKVAREVTVEATRPAPQAPEDRRFQPKAELQSSGELTKDQLLAFCEGIKDILASDESVALLAAAPAEAAGQLSIAWQREYLEHLGIEQDFGCAALVPAAQKFQGDERARKAFLGFQTACVMSMKKAALVREEQAKKGEDGGGS